MAVNKVVLAADRHVMGDVKVAQAAQIHAGEVVTVVRDALEIVKADAERYVALYVKDTAKEAVMNFVYPAMKPAIVIAANLALERAMETRVLEDVIRNVCMIVALDVKTCAMLV